MTLQDISDESLPPENDGKKIDIVMSLATCHYHNAVIDAPCYVVYSMTGQMLFGVCNNRALKAGYDGKITPYVRPKKTTERRTR